MVSIQSSYTFPSKCKCSSPFGNLVSCSSLTSCLYSLNCFSYGHVICGTSCLCSLSFVFCGIVIYGIFEVHLPTYTIVGTAFTTIGIANGFTPPFIIFCALKSLLSCSFFTPQFKAPPSLILFFLLRTLLGEFCCNFLSVLQCCLHLLPSSFNLGWQFLLILLLMHKQILKDFCQY